VSDAARLAVLAAIPHREPFLFVDGVIERDESSLSARWHVPPDGAWFRGHYPGSPVLPGVLIQEHCFQSAAILVSELRGGLASERGIPVLARVENARFKRLVRPGETLVTRVELRETLGPAWYLSAHVRCDDATVLRIRFVLTSGEALAESED
jgi:3-hydroxyacyl-[acyl-carrier-protein] dehydratase